MTPPNDSEGYDPVAAYNKAVDANRKPLTELRAPRNHQTLSEPDQERLDKPPFLALGHNDGRHYFFSQLLLQVRDYSAQQLTTLGGLYDLADLDWWIGAFPPLPGSRGTFDHQRAGSWLVQLSSRAGVYDPARIRGVGVWMDAGRVVAHLGNRLWVDGKERALLGFRSEWLYVQRAPLKLDTTAPEATPEEGRLLIDLCAGISWVHPERDALLLAGWLAIAPVCGALRWRPHVWLNSDAGEGKTWIGEHIIQPVLGPLALPVAATTTAPGIKRDVGGDARTLVFDEAEGDTQDGQTRLQAVIQLMRQSSSDSSGAIVQAQGAGPEVLRFRPKFIGVLSSVHVSLTTSADSSRFLPMPMRESSAEEFEELKRRAAACLTLGFSDRLFLRMLRLVPVLRANIDVMQMAIAAHANKRAGDTLGTVLAGLFMLTSEERLTPAAAEAWVKANTWLQEAAVEQVPLKEWQLMLAYLGQQRLRINTANGLQEFALSEIVCLLAQRESAPTRVLEDLRRAFGQAGLQVVVPRHQEKLELCVLVSNTSAQVQLWLQGKPWAAGWRALLKRAGAVPVDNHRFPGLGGSHRALAIPLSMFLGAEANLPSEEKPSHTEP